MEKQLAIERGHKKERAIVEGTMARSNHIRT
jgi:hypothetical protein